MTYAIACLGVFLASYMLNIFYVTVLYHRGLTHGAVELHPFTRKLVIHTGNWVTGLDPKGWTAMHRMHHKHSDTELDPHSPRHHNVFFLMWVQLKSYNRILKKLIVGERSTTESVKDLGFEVSWLNRNRLWVLPYVLHAAIALGLGVFGHLWLLGAAYWLGMMTHPIQGWLVNAFAHKYGSRNFETPDDSRNNTAVAWLVFGEGFQNNHHHAPRSANFAMRAGEVDLGYGLVLAAQKLGMLRVVASSSAAGDAGVGVRGAVGLEVHR